MSLKSDQNSDDANIRKIIRPQNAAKGKTFDDWITFDSDDSQRTAVVQMFRYATQETGFRMDLIEHPDCWREAGIEILPVVDEAEQRNGIIRNALIGFIRMDCVREIPVLNECYLHPSFRGEPNSPLRPAWRCVNQRFPKFQIEIPISSAFQFLLIENNFDLSHVTNQNELVDVIKSNVIRITSDAPTQSQNAVCQLLSTS